MARTSAATGKAASAAKEVKAAQRAAPNTAAKPAVAEKRAAKPAAKAAVKTKPAAKPAAKAPARAKPAAPAQAIKAAARKLAPAAKPRTRATDAAQLEARAEAGRPQLVRDSFTMPEGEYAVLGSVKQACLKAGFEVKKSELLRIGVALLGQLDTATLRTVLAGLPQLKTGRPAAE